MRNKLNLLPALLTYFFAPGLIIALVFVAFGNTLGAYFNCDDFLHLPYLYRLFHGEPELLAANFTGPWIGERSLYLFFRPITELSLIVDYAINQARPFGYHLSNLLWHSANAILLYLLCLKLLAALELSEIKIGTRKTQAAMALCTALIFAVFPTHSEAVAWILSRADLVCTFFYLLSLYCFIAFKSKMGKGLSVFAFVLSLLSKEMAISLPAVIFALSMILSQENIRTKLKFASVECAPYVVAVVFYLPCRYLALGSLVGGYIGSVGERLNENYIDRWLRSGSLWQLMQPFNQAIFTESNPLRLMLRIIYALAAAMALVGALLDEDKGRRKMLAFALIFFALTMLPNFQVWGISTSMSGGRIAYLPATALALAIVSSVFFLPQALETKSRLNYKGVLSALSIGLLLSMSTCFAAISKGNNKAWLNASEMIRDLQSQVNSEVKTLTPGQNLVIFNLPSRVDGAFTFTMRKMLAGLFQPPLNDDIQNRVIALDFHSFWSPLLSSSDLAIMRQYPDLYKIEAWDNALKRLVPFEAKPADGSALPQLKMVAAHGPHSSSYYISADRPINPAAAEFLQVDVCASKNSAMADAKASLFLLWNNRPADQDDQTEPHWTEIEADGKPRSILIELAPQKRWILSKNVSMMRIDVDTDKYKWIILNPVLIGRGLTPSLQCKNQTDNSSLTPLNLDSKSNSIDMVYKISDGMARKVSGEIIVEISKAQGQFEHYDDLMRGIKPAKQAMLTCSIKSGNSFTIVSKGSGKVSDYQVRVAAVDSSGKVAGTFSDPVGFRSTRPESILSSAK